MGPPPMASSGLAAWFQLIRPANVATALADILAGYAVTGLAPASALAWLLAATAGLYAGGIVLNDVCDRRLDALERPERPIPSGRISATAAGFLAVGLLAFGVGSAFMVGLVSASLALATVAAVVVYDAWSKHHAFLGPINMGLCRALNLMLGVSAAPASLAANWPLALLPLVYIAAVTVVSRGEVQGARRHIAQLAFVLVGGVTLALLGLVLRGGLDLDAVWGLALTAALGWRVLGALALAVRTPEPATMRRAVRTGVLSLVLLDAVIAATYADIIYSLAVLLTGVVAARLARLFAVT